jgi:hypothetical protein
VLFAREEGRRQGFEEGIQQGRLAVFAAPDARYLTARAQATPLGSGAAFIEEFDDSASSTDVDESRRHLPNQTHHQHPDMARGMHSTRGPEGTHKTRPRHASLDSAPRGRSRVPRSGTPSQVNTPRTQPQHVHVNGNHVPQQGTSSVGASSEDSAVRRELEAVKQQTEALKREVEQREAIRVYETQLAEQREREREAERERLRNREAELEREKEALREKEREREAERERETKAIRERDAERERKIEREREEMRQRERERERELAQQREREREAREREAREDREREREREREKERERESEREREKEREKEKREQEKREKEKRDKERPTRLPYLAMPPPPGGVLPGVVPPPPIIQSPARSQTTPEIRVFPAALHQPQQMQPDPRRPQRRRTSSTDTTRSPSSSTSMSQLEIITFPSSGMNSGKIPSGRGDETDRIRPHGLPDIPEGSEGPTSAATASPPSWLHNPPVDHMKRALRGQDPTDVENWRQSTSDLVRFSLSRYSIYVS